MAVIYVEKFVKTVKISVAGIFLELRIVQKIGQKHVRNFFQSIV